MVFVEGNVLDIVFCVEDLNFEIVKEGESGVGEPDGAGLGNGDRKWPTFSKKF